MRKRGGREFYIFRTMEIRKKRKGRSLEGSKTMPFAAIGPKRENNNLEIKRGPFCSTSSRGKFTWCFRKKWQVVDSGVEAVATVLEGFGRIARCERRALSRARRCPNRNRGMRRMWRARSAGSAKFMKKMMTNDAVTIEGRI